MSHYQKIFLFLLRISLGWLFFYAGITKVINPNWSAAGYLGNAKTFSGLFSWFAQPGNIGWVSFLAEWGLVLVGVSLIAGFLVRWSSLGGILLMILFYLPILAFPIVGEHSYIVDEHIIYIFVFAVLALFNAGVYWGLDRIWKK
ncbi:MAG: DoxX family protein [bacterium]|nr:DoxX family protein [bacterium]